MRPAILFLLLSSPLLAQDEPKAVLKAPAEISQYKLGIFDGSESVGDFFTYQVYFHGGITEDKDEKQRRINEAVRLLEGEKYVVTAPAGEDERDYWVSQDGLTLIVPPVPGRQYVVFFSASNAKGNVSTMAQAKVKGTSPPAPPPQPPDPPPPGPPPPNPPTGPDLDLSQEAAQWLALVPAAVRGEVFTHPISGDTMTRQQAIGRTFREVGGVAGELGSFEAVDMMLSIGLAPGFMPNAEVWQPFSSKADAALEDLKTKGVTVAQYGQALQSIGRALE